MYKHWKNCLTAPTAARDFHVRSPGAPLLPLSLSQSVHTVHRQTWLGVFTAASLSLTKAEAAQGFISNRIDERGIYLCNSTPVPYSNESELMHLNYLGGLSQTVGFSLSQSGERSQTQESTRCVVLWVQSLQIGRANLQQLRMHTGGGVQNNEEKQESS